jgi:drug/metabolite transporter (DMT)-like permease
VIQVPYLGQTAALGTAICWALTALVFAKAGRRIGSHAVNSLRLLFAVAFFMVLMLALGSGPWPWDLSSRPLLLLSVSGVVGLALGDAALFHAYVLIGARLGSLMMSLWPAIAAILGFFLLGETLSLFSLFGMALTMGSVAWVVFDRHSAAEDQPAQPQESVTQEPGSHGRFAFGILCALGGVVGQAVGIVLAKMAMLGAEEQGLAPIDPLPATFARTLAAALVIWLYLIARGQTKPIMTALFKGQATQLLVFGSIVGPFLGVWLSLVAGLNTELGIAGALMATSPIWVIPLVIVFDNEKVSSRAWFGAFGAFSGVAILFIAR